MNSNLPMLVNLSMFDTYPYLGVSTSHVLLTLSIFFAIISLYLWISYLSTTVSFVDDEETIECVVNRLRDMLQE